MYNGMHVTADLSQYTMFIIVSIIVVGMLLQTLLIFAFVRYNVANLEYRLLDKAALCAALEPYGIYELDRFDEKKPGLVDTVMDKSYPYVHCMQSALYHFAEGGNCIILGRGGQFLFRPLPGAVKQELQGNRFE